MTKRKSILFIVPYPEGEAPSQRFRFEQYFEALQSNHLDYQTQSFLTSSNWRVFYSPGNTRKKAAALLLGFWRRTVGLIAVRQADFVFIHREASPVGPPIFEWIIAKILRKRIIYDFDDALWLTDRSDEVILTRIAKGRGKISSICKWSYRVSCGNAYLCDYAKNFNTSVTCIPTTVDTAGRHNPKVIPTTSYRGDEIVIGWTGSRTTLKYLEVLEPALQELETNFSNVTFLVIADEAPMMKLKRLIYVPWNKHSEIEDLKEIDIGIMPLPNDEWSKGKCGFKILQYMALEIPSVSSPVGVNSDIVQNGYNGFLANNEHEWVELIGRLIVDPILRREIGLNGRKTVVRHYSVSSNTLTFVSLFE